MDRRRALLVLAGAVLLAATVAFFLLRPPAGPVGAARPGDAPAVAGAGRSVPGAPPAAPEDAPSPLPAPRGALEGVVRSTGTGQPVPGAELTFSRADAAASVRSGPDGAFRLDPPDPGRWQLAAASAPGFAPFAPEWGHSAVAFEARAGERVSGVTIWLRPELRIAGRVVSAEGEPVPGAEIRILGGAAGDRALLPSAIRVTSGADGAFALGASEGDVLEARHAGFAPGRAAVDLQARVSRRVVVRLGRAEPAATSAAIAGRVTSQGAPVEGALVSGRLLLRGGPGSASDSVSAQALADAEGRFTLRDLEAGRYLLTAAREGLTQSQAVVARAGEEATIELVRGGRITGTVRAAGTGRPVAPVRIVVMRGGRGWRLPIRTAGVLDASGRFEIADLPPGPVVLVASSPGLLPSDDVEVAVPEHPGAVDVEIRLREGGRIAGRVTDRVSGQPIAFARVVLEGDAATSVLDAGPGSVTGADGAFELGGLPSQPASLHVSAEGHDARIVGGIEVRDGAVAGPVEVRLSPVAEGDEPRLELAGIGASLERRGRSALRIAAVVPGGGAAEAGLLPGDEILSVEGRPISELGFGGAVDLIRGPEDTRVRLTVRRGDATPAEIWVWRRLVRG